MVKFSKKEIDFINRQEACRLATVSKDGMPHVVPVGHLFEKGIFYICVDYGTKKLQNVRENPKVSLVVDVYRDPHNAAVFIQGNAKIIERGKEYKEIYGKFYKKFYWVRAKPWKEGEAPFLKITPIKKVSWF